ncbi:MAG: prepilin peptidase [Deltaproteobacteria bacterium]
MNSLSRDYIRTKIRKPQPLLTGLDARLYWIEGSIKGGKKTLKKLLDEAEAIDSLGASYKEMSEEELGSTLAGFKDNFRRRKKGFEEALPEALAAVREAAGRKLGLRPFVVQLAGALALHRGIIAEMATGEGKTLSAALAGVINGWIGLPCHIITVNDYLAERDAEWMEPLYKFCGVTVGCVTGQQEAAERRQGHGCDVTYTTSKEIVADFLRDRLWLGEMQNAGRRQIRMLLGRQADIERGLVMRGIHFGIVDEADSILIDEAVTPLIISRQVPNDTFIETCKATHAIAQNLERGKDYTVNQRYKEIELDPGLKDRLADRLKEMPGTVAGSAGARLEMIRLALQAREFFHLDQEFVIQDNKVVIVDEFTGRIMPQRSWQSGLHQFVEAKENLEMTVPTETLARLSFQRFFRFFRCLGGMTGTARESASELWDIYQVPVVSIPENKPCQRIELPTMIFRSQEEKWQAILEEITAMHGQGRPVLVGTRSVRASENLSARLTAAGLAHRVLNAVRHNEEARIVSHAGETASITIATNMAGRGTDIKLEVGVAQKGGLHVIASECHESRRIDRQLFGRAARQGDPGSARLFVSMEDDLVCRYLPKAVRAAVKSSLGKKSRGSEWLAAKAVRWAQLTAQSLAFRRRRAVLRMDTWLDDSLSFTQGDVM